ncbi:MAG TPA: xanthine dehydrogenase family protein subunit M [Chloroflexota bacterium]|jgi:carbon-monoxide dehydrogenase medium subunit
MRRFELLEPTSLREACELLAADEGAKLIAGGTVLLILIKHGVFLPETLINLKKVQGADEISYDPARGLRLGALATIHQVERASVVRAHYPLLAEACHVVANVRIRNSATIGGNVAHGDYQSDPPTALLALESRVELTSLQGTRELPLDEFLLGTYETALAPGEVLSAVLVPPPPDMRGTYLKFTTRSSEDRPTLGVAALVRQRDGVCEAARLVIGAASPTPVRVWDAEALAVGQPLGADLVQQMAAAAGAAIDPVDDLHGPADYKRHVAQVLARRALTACLDGEPP